jgi:dolichyl-phosphate-mannose--protein O-mannosyl transferase
MSLPPDRPRDPIGWTVALAFAFLVLAAVRLAVPSTPYFDEVHYLPAARELLAFSEPRNMEHPPLGKQILALGMVLFGDRPLGWRIMPLLFGLLALVGAMRAMWFASGSAGSSLLTGFFLATGFPLIVHARIAMLDIFMLGFLMLGLWMCAAAMREPETARRRLPLAGVALGAAMACKWNAVPLVALPGLAFLAIRLVSTRTRFLWSARGAPVPGITLAEAFVWLGLLPLAVYAASYWPFPLLASPEPSFAGRSFLAGLVELHGRMLDLQTQLKTPHPYQSTWPEWVINWRAIWYLYEPVDGAQRGVLLIGNPLSVLAGLPALVWCAFAGAAGLAGVSRSSTAAIAAGAAGRRHDALAVALLYAASLGTWIIAPKPVQFYYHYLLPSCFLLAALALATERLWRRGWRTLPIALVISTAGLFAYFYPILSAAPLGDEQAFLRWAWLESWR